MSKAPSPKRSKAKPHRSKAWWAAEFTNSGALFPVSRGKAPWLFASRSGARDLCRHLHGAVVVRVTVTELASDLATKIADLLFTNAAKQKAKRLVLTGPNGEDLGGWCHAAVVDQIRMQSEKP